jgi:hypothetical protein
MDKKGDAVKFSIEMILKFLGITLLAFIAIQLVIGLYGRGDLETNEIRRETFFNRVITHGLVSNGTPPGTVNLSLFNAPSLEQRIDYGSERVIAAKLLLVYDTGDTPTAYYNKPRYDTWAPLAKANIEGEGSADIERRAIPVTVENERALLVIEAVTPR